MRRQIVRIAPLQAAKVSAVLYFIIGAVFAAFMAAGVLIEFATDPDAGAPGMGIALVVAIPFVYALGGFVFVPIFCWLYNLVARWIGGFEVSVEDVP